MTLSQHMHARGLLVYSLYVVLFAITLSGCARQTKVVLLPDPSGNVGKLTITSDAGTVQISKTREATTVKGRQSAPSSPTILSEQEIQKDFSEALQTLPEQPVHFILYFKKGSNKLTDTSRKRIEEVMATVEKRESQHISVIGHTDTAGNPEYNLRLSSLRAQAIAEILKDKGIQSSHIKTTSHGENNPLIPTKDNVHEPRNRRVEVVIR